MRAKGIKSRCEVVIYQDFMKSGLKRVNVLNILTRDGYHVANSSQEAARLSSILLLSPL